MGVPRKELNRFDFPVPTLICSPPERSRSIPIFSRAISGYSDCFLRVKWDTNRKVPCCRVPWDPDAISGSWTDKDRKRPSMASKSRIHVNIARLREIESRKQEHLKGDDWQEPVLKIDDKSIMGYAGWYFDNYPEQCWNGRQIRNAFQIASSLAQYDMNKTSLDVWNDDKSNEGRSDRSAAYQILNWIQFDKVADDLEYPGTVYRPQYQPSEAGRGRPAGSSSQPSSFHHDPRSSTPRPPAQGQQQAFYQIERRENLGTRHRQRQRRQYHPPPSTSATLSKQPSRAQMDFHELDWDDETSVDGNEPRMLDEE
ncbi:hypothetical protein AFGD_010069 [Aspergillus flavus]|nr:hypothetical protein AFGD_010069 [Aspergillus flavus]